MLEPGYIYFTRQATTIATVLGSCVSVCLWDRRQRFGGINHFLYPSTHDPVKATPKYGNAATLALAHMMTDAGCVREDMVAHVLGGAFPEEAEGQDIGAENVAVARKILQHKEIRIVSEDVGGCMGRKVIFDTGTGRVVVVKVHKLRKTDWLLHPAG